MKTHFILVVLAFLAIPVAKGQLQIETLSNHPTWNADSLVRNIMLGECVEIMNVQLNGSSGVIGGQTGVGIFTTGNNPTNLGLQSGICLSASAMSYINTTGGTGTNNSTLSTDADLYAIVGMAVNNCMVLEFDFVPRADSVRFCYVFASEEYYGYECSPFSDAIAFFLSGENPDGGVYNKLNIARVPNTETPISISTVNGGESHGSNTPCILTNTQYFVDNRAQAHVKHMDGFTTVLTAEARVIPCQTYHLKMAVANVSDNALPSAVFLEANSLTSGMCPCLPPTTPIVTDVSYDRVTVGWTSNNQQSVAYIHLSHNAADTVIVANTNPFTINGLAQNITYSIAVADSCTNNGLISEYSDPVSFTTPTCQPVTGVSVADVATTSALISWMGNAPSYTIEYGIGNFTSDNGTRVTTEESQLLLTDLTPDEDYTLYVRANCTEADYSLWSDSVAFHTSRQGISQPTGNCKLLIYPNPTKDKTTICITGIRGEVMLTIVDMNGRTVKEVVAECNDNCSAVVELSDLPAATYFVHAAAEGTTIVRSLVVK